MKKLLAISLTLAMIIMLLPVQMVSVSAVFDDFQFWTINTSSGAPTVERVWDSTNNRWAAKLRSSGTAANPLLTYNITNLDKYFTSGHTYKLWFTFMIVYKTKINESSPQNWFPYSLGGKGGTPWVGHYNEGQTYVRTGESATYDQLSVDPTIKFGFTGSGHSTILIENVIVKDITNGEDNATVVNLPNLDFSLSYNFPHWQYASTTGNTKVERVWDSKTSRYAMKLTKLPHTANNDYDDTTMMYYLPESLLTVGQKYCVDLYYKSVATGASQHLAVNAGGAVHTNIYLANNYTGGYRGNSTFQFTYGGTNNYIAFGIRAGGDKHSASIMIEDVSVHLVTADGAKGEKISGGLPNLDFSISEYDAETANAVNMRNWKVLTDTPDAVAEKVYHYNTIDNEWSYMLRLTNLGNGKNINKVRYRIPREKLAPGHLYTVSMYLSAICDMAEVINKTSYYGGYLYFKAASKIYSNTFLPYLGTRTLTLVDCDLYDKNFITFGFDTIPTTRIEWYFDNLVITDQSTGQTLTLVNPDFEETHTDYIDFYSDDGTTATADICSSTGSNNIILGWSKISTAGGVDTLAKMGVQQYSVSQSNALQTFTITPETADGYTTKAYLWKASDYSALAKALSF